MARSRNGRSTSPRRRGNPAVSARRDNDNNAVSERLRSFLLELGITRYELRKATGLPQASITGWFGVPPKLPGTAHLIVVSRKYGLSLDWLLLGEGPMLRPTPAAAHSWDRLLRAQIASSLEKSGIPNDVIKRELPRGESVWSSLILQYFAACTAGVDDEQDYMLVERDGVWQKAEITSTRVLRPARKTGETTEQ